MDKAERGTGGNAAFKRNFQRSETERVQVLWSHNRLCVHAGGGHGQRSYNRMPLPRACGPNGAGALMQTVQTRDLGVLGAGLAGCIAALELGRLGYRVILLDQMPRPMLGAS